MEQITKATPLTREEMKRVIEGKGAARRVPMVFKPWFNEKVFGAESAKYGQLMEQYPCDAEVIELRTPDVFRAPQDDAGYRWMNMDDPFPPGTPLDAVSALEWEHLDEVLADFPDPHYPALIPDAPPVGNTYRVAVWWYWLFERLWSLRGMENALCDFYEFPDEVHRMFRALTDFYKVMLTRVRRELHADAVWTSDDIGVQNGPFFSLEIFREFFKPYYKELIAHAHSLGMHFWMHSCGNIETFIPDLIEIGLDVLHPIQTYTMDQREIARKYGGSLCIWAGFDVQRIIPYGTPQQVRAEVRRMIDTYSRPDGRFILTAGNALTADTPYESLHALLDESLVYGTKST